MATSPVKALTSCDAATNTQFRTCVQQATSGQVNIINVTAQIECTNTVPCSYDLINIPNPLLIRGTTATSGFLRTGGYQNRVFRISGGKNLIMQNLTFKDATNVGCKAADLAICADVILANDATQATFHNLKFLDINRVALTVNSYTKSNNYTVQNSLFRNMGLHGFNSSYIDSAPKGGITKILNNTFENSKSSAINLSVNSSTTAPSIISGNIVSHTHNTAMYSCGTDMGCDGGQIYVFVPLQWKPNSVTENVIVEKNLIQNGYSPGGPRVWGVEIFNHSMKNIKVSNNVIIDHNSPVILDMDPTQNVPFSTNISITDNWFTNFQYNVLTFNNTVLPVISNNITTLTRDQALAKFTQIRPPAPPAPSFNVNTTTPTPVATAPSKTGDVNGDNKVDIVDIGIVIDNYGRNPIPNPKSDINRDGLVNIIDIGMIIDNYGK